MYSTPRALIERWSCFIAAHHFQPFHQSWFWCVEPSSSSIGMTFKPATWVRALVGSGELFLPTTMKMLGWKCRFPRPPRKVGQWFGGFWGLVVIQNNLYRPVKSRPVASPGNTRRVAERKSIFRCGRERPICLPPVAEQQWHAAVRS